MPILQGGIFRQPMTEEMAKGAEHFIRKGLIGYDACYAALSAKLDGIWLTFDKRAHECLFEEKVSHLLSEKLPDAW